MKHKCSRREFLCGSASAVVLMCVPSVLPSDRYSISFLSGGITWVDRAYDEKVLSTLRGPVTDAGLRRHLEG